MFVTRVAAIGIVLGLAVPALGYQAPAEFSAEATALPFPPDAKEIEFKAVFGDIEYTSASPLLSLAAFYLKEMASRGWQHEEAAAVVEKETIKLTFKHDAATVKVELRQYSKEVRVSLDCEKLQFAGTDDAAKLAAAGVPVPKAILLLQKEFPPTEGAVGLRLTADGYTFKSPQKLEESYGHFTKLAAGKGFRESRRPIVTATRRYTEFQGGTAELSVNVFTDAVGSRIVLSYKDAAGERPVPPLAAVASLPIKGGASSQPATSGTALAAANAPAANATPIDVAGNKGSAIIDYAGKRYTLANVACYQPKGREPTLLFSAKPIPLNKLQALVAAKDDVSLSDLYELSWPDHFTLQLGAGSGFSFGAGGVALSRPVKDATGEIKIEAGRAKGTMKVPPVVVFGNEMFSFTATADAAIITPTTRITGPGDPAAGRSDNPTLAAAPLPFPDGVESAGSEGTKFRKKYSALVVKPVAEVAAFYNKELAGKGWTQADSTGNARQFKDDKQELSLTLKEQRGKTLVELFVRDTALAKQQGIFPEAGKGRLILGNAGNSAVVFSFGGKDYPLKASQGGGKDFQGALNQSLAPGAYSVVLKVPGQPQETEKIELTEGTVWGLIALPGGGCLPVQLY